MSFNFGNDFSINKAQGAYKDASGMGGGGMYMRQKKKRKEDEDEDIFQRSEEKEDNEIAFSSDINDEEIPHDNIVNKFVNWFRQGNNN